MPSIYPVVSVIVPYRKGPGDEQTYVMVREKESGLWNQPGEGVDFADKDFVNAAAREVCEESGLTVSIYGFVGFYSFQSRRENRILCASFLGKPIEGALRTNAEDIADVKDFTLSQIREIYRRGELRSGFANLRPVEDFLRRGTFSLDELFHFLG